MGNIFHNIAILGGLCEVFKCFFIIVPFITGIRVGAIITAVVITGEPGVYGSCDFGDEDDDEESDGHC